MKETEIQFKVYGESAILIEWSPQINAVILNDIRKFSNKISENDIDGIVDVNYVYHSLLVTFDRRIVSSTSLIMVLKKLYKSNSETTIQKPRTWSIPVLYQTDFDTELSEFLIKNKISNSELIGLHTSATYTVFGIGFLPGFLYLGGLSGKLNIPRKWTPSKNIPKGTVAIAGGQTGIYPQDSPGGWHAIGKTPIPFFNSSKDPPTFISAGDFVTFSPISKDGYKVIQIELEAGIYNFKTIIND